MPSIYIRGSIGRLTRYTTKIKYLLSLFFLLAGCNASNKVIQKGVAINHVVIMELHDSCSDFNEFVANYDIALC